MHKNFIRRGAFGAVLAGLAAGSLSAVAAAECTNDVWNNVMQRGKVIVGVKADYKPWGFRGEDGAVIGMEADLAQDVADAMGVENAVALFGHLRPVNGSYPCDAGQTILTQPFRDGPMKPR